VVVPKATADRAVKEVNGAELDGSQLMVQLAVVPQQEE
jgi:hypothetical protein